VFALAANCPSLTALYLERAGRVHNESVRALAAGCRSLRVLDLGWCDVGDEALEALAQARPAPLRLGRHPLASLRPAPPEPSRRPSPRTPPSQCCPDLSTVNLAYCEAVSDKGLDDLTAGCASLASLDIGGCSRLTERALHSIAAHCPRLLSLDLGGCKHLVSDPSLLLLARACPALRSLNLRFCELVSEAAIDEVQACCVNVQVRR
jgi:hypothetical protein